MSDPLKDDWHDRQDWFAADNINAHARKINQLDDSLSEAITEDLADRQFSWEDAGEGQGYPAVGGAPIGPARPWPAATASNVAGLPELQAAAAAIIDRKTPQALPEVFSAFATKQDGPAPTKFDSGQTVLGSSGPGTDSQAIVLNGLLTSQPTNHGPAAYYYIGQCAGPVKRIGGRFRMHANELNPETPTYDGSVTLAILLSNDWSDGPPAMAVHYVIKGDSWAIGPRESPENGGTFAVLGSQDFYPPLKFDGTTEYEAEVWLDGDTCTFTTPDGGRFTVSDSRFSSYDGAYFFFEHQAPVADTDNRTSFTHIWASSGKQYLPNQDKPAWLHARKAVSASTVTVGGAYVPLNVPGIVAGGEGRGSSDYVTVPPSGKVLVSFDCHVIRATAAEVRLGLTYADGSQAKVIGDITEGKITKTLTFTDTVEGLTPGLAWTCTPVLYSSATDTQIRVDPGNGFGACMTIQPL